MNSLIRLPLKASLTSALLLASASAFATEGGLGRPITGMQILPLSGILPTEKGLTLSFSSVFYEGSLKGNREVPISGRTVSGGLDYHISYNVLNAVYVWGEQGRWTYGSAVGLPFQYTDIKASLNGPRRSFSGQDTSTNMADMTFSPLMADYHFSQLSHVLFNLQIYAPTGSYDKNQLANAGQNTWTFIPSVAYTTIFPESNIELSAVGAVEFYTRNDDTDYQNGTLVRVDALALKRFGQVGDGWGLGVNVGWIQQVEDDSGPTADRLDGFRGRAFGVGPILSYEKKVGSTHLVTSLRWVHEFDTDNRPEGDSAQLNVTAQF